MLFVCVVCFIMFIFFFFSSRRRHTRWNCDWSSDVCSSDLAALRIAPHLTACWCNLGSVQMQSGNAEGAIALYHQALKTNASHWPSRINLAQALIANGRMEEAKALLTDLVRERPQDGSAWHYLGKACFELKEIEAALSHFGK